MPESAGHKEMAARPVGARASAWHGATPSGPRRVSPDERAAMGSTWWPYLQESRCGDREGENASACSATKDGVAAPKRMNPRGGGETIQRTQRVNPRGGGEMIKRTQRMNPRGGGEMIKRTQRMSPRGRGERVQRSSPGEGRDKQVTGGARNAEHNLELGQRKLHRAQGGHTQEWKQDNYVQEMATRGKNETGEGQCGPWCAMRPLNFQIEPERVSAAARWHAWARTVRRYGTVMNVDTEQRQKCLLLLLAGSQILKVYDELNDVEYGGLSWQATVDAIGEKLITKVNRDYARLSFRRMRQAPGERTEDFTARLSEVAWCCKFGDEEGKIREQLTVGCASPKLRRHAWENPQKGLRELVEDSKNAEQAERDATDVEQWKNESSKSAGKAEEKAMEGEQWGRQPENRRHATWQKSLMAKRRLNKQRKTTFRGVVVDCENMALEECGESDKQGSVVDCENMALEECGESDKQGSVVDCENMALGKCSDSDERSRVRETKSEHSPGEIGKVQQMMPTEEEEASGNSMKERAQSILRAASRALRQGTDRKDRDRLWSMMREGGHGRIQEVSVRAQVYSDSGGGQQSADGA